MSGICECGHIDAGHFDEVGPCSSCECERFKDKGFVRCEGKLTSPASVWRCTLPAGHEGDHACRRPDGALVRSWLT